jgi:hypothetical protein
MRTLLKCSALLAAALVLLPFDGFAQGRGQGGGGDQVRAQERAQAERGQMDRDRDRVRDQDRTHQPATAPAYEGTQSQQQKQVQQREQVQEQEQKQIHVPDTGNGPDSDIYGHELMTVQERNQYREQLRLVESDPEKKTRFEAQHREQMQTRAKAQGFVIDDGEIEEAE